jgi:hypothetical protein
MSRPFINISSANRAFGEFKEPTDAGDYIQNKKARAKYCVANKCAPSIKVYSESDRLLFNKSNQLSLYPCANGINTANLNINLITRLNLREISVVKDLSNNTVPAVIDTNSIPFLRYEIDPSGTLFGNSICGINNFTKLLTPNQQPSPYIIISGNYEITSDTTYNTIITFYGNSVIEFTKSIKIDYTIVGGGGGGGGGNIGGSPGAGGGGGGGVKTGTFNSNNIEYAITVGLGGQGGLLQTTTSSTNGGNGSLSSISGIDTANGGFGGKASSNNNGAGGDSGNGGAGGIGGQSPGANGTNGGGGGGGAYLGSQVGGNGSVSTISVYTYGTSFGSGGGGGGGNNLQGGKGGNIYAGNGGIPGKNATANYGGGGGGSTSGNGLPGTYGNGGNGGSGRVILYFNV